MTVRNGTVDTRDSEPCRCGWKLPAAYRVLVLDEDGRTVAPLHPNRYLLELLCPYCNAGFTLMSESTSFDQTSAEVKKEEKEVDGVSLN